MEDNDFHQLLDLSAYIKLAAEKGVSKETILIHVKHDVDGLLNKAEDPFWTPRTGGWHKDMWDE
tara:strand:+ start:425 stop:616 length:192 start_codon:yes stop_codon:yes gene_type:complete